MLHFGLGQACPKELMQSVLVYVTDKIALCAGIELEQAQGAWWAALEGFKSGTETARGQECELQIRLRRLRALTALRHGAGPLRIAQKMWRGLGGKASSCGPKGKSSTWPLSISKA
jgi:hypothetical protein